MRLIVTKNYEEMSKVAAKEMAEDIKRNPEIVLGLATGGTPVGMYKELIRMYNEGELDFSKVTSINLDEYVGLSGDHDQSYRYFMNTNLFDHINIDKNNTFVPNGLAENVEEECMVYDSRIQDMGGIDLQLLGLGANGHIGFNEPGEALSVGTHLTDLKESTIEANARFFDSIDDVPRKAITMGLGGIMKAKKIMVIASGEGKAEVVEAMMSGKITTEIPATMLQMHRDVVLIVDEDAAKLLK
ncbi:glucosamine-6-phosphate deaminase [Clostridium perfringens]|uniref:Glucosamine-6-phosphate deaminase n=1 Tax=Clostridium perfringens D str. JGS1721 TaxID=488537 RepID=B1V4L7_CLOPF|nr:glucosamine-6-phosphate deaminase [Clostridium perfringens]EDT71246.1 glucosamine-6-phosphate isomerase [Clostridium perfringens D str. JGS1721]ELC8457781.1 glucosamine-6-phosphate deaminase [Clostridium perfringens]PWX06404.1 glucosamine-6-phosphate deaminase [Clostridium perfringens]